MGKDLKFQFFVNWSKKAYIKMKEEKTPFHKYHEKKDNFVSHQNSRIFMSVKQEVNRVSKNHLTSSSSDPTTDSRSTCL